MVINNHKLSRGQSVHPCLRSPPLLLLYLPFFPPLLTSLLLAPSPSLTSLLFSSSPIFFLPPHSLLSPLALFSSPLLSQIQIASKEKAKYRSSLDCGKKLFKEGGLRSLYRGTFATLLRGGHVTLDTNHMFLETFCMTWFIPCVDVPASGVYFSAYEGILQFLTPQETR